MELLPAIGTQVRVTLDVQKEKEEEKEKEEKSISVKNLFIAKRRLNFLEVTQRRKQIFNPLKKRKEVNLVTPLKNRGYKETFLKLK